MRYTVHRDDRIHAPLMYTIDVRTRVPVYTVCSDQFINRTCLFLTMALRRGPHLDIDSRNQPQYSISPLVQLVVATKGGIRFGVRRQSLDIFAGLAACSNLRELSVDRLSLLGSRHMCTLPNLPC